MTFARRIVSEGLGTAFLLAIVVGSGIMAERLAGGNVALALLANAIATGAGLAALILMFGTISGAHFNPVVTLSEAWQKNMPRSEVLPYIAVQVAGAFAGVAGAHLMFGIPFSDGPGQYANSVAGIAPSGQQYRYDKHHLVPFGEFVPPGFRWFVDMMAIPLGDMTRGAPVQTAFAVKDQMVLPNVCYEDVFGEEIALQLRSMSRPATMLLNVSNLAWFGESIAIPQHLQISRMRSIETGRPMLRSTNTGATAVIDHRGQVAASLDNYTHGVLQAQVQGMGGMTPYIRMGNYLFLGLAAAALGAAWWLGRRRKLSQSPQK